MKLSQKTNYALKVLLDLSNRYLDDRVHIADLSQRQGIPPKYLERVLSRLKKGGFIRSKMGPGGGYALDRAPHEIILGDVLRWMEPSQFGFAHGDGADTSNAVGRDGLFGIMAEIGTAVEKVIDSIDFGEIRKREAEALAGENGGDIYYI